MKVWPKAVAMADPELAGAEAAEGVATGDEGCALVAHHAHAANVHHLLLLPSLADVLVALAFLVCAAANESHKDHHQTKSRNGTKQYINILHTWYTHKAMTICMTQHI